jgi:hypothetical protein
MMSPVAERERLAAQLRARAQPGANGDDDRIIAYALEYGSKSLSDADALDLARRRLGITSNGAAPNGRTGPGAPRWPEPAAATAYHGIAGEVVRTIEPHSEADPHALLGQFLGAFGSAVGRSAGFEAESSFHATNTYWLIVGETSKGRKGSSFAQARRPVELADETWRERVVSGLSSGEGLVYAVRDPVEQRRKARKNEEPDPDGYLTEITDEGESDKRCLAFESEFASVLRVMRRDGSTLSTVIRQAWESGELRTLTRNSPLHANGAHVSIVGHIVAEELRRELLTTDAASGFANRFLFVCARRSKLLPEGGSLTDADWAPILPDLEASFRFARDSRGVLRRDDEARRIWAEVYPRLSAGEPGLYGAVTSRAEAQVMRLSVIYAILDRSPRIGRAHLEAALALWRYCADSARYVFGASLGDEDADLILAGLREAGHSGLDRTAIRDLFGRHKPASQVERALGALAGLGLAFRGERATGGRSAEVWYAEGFACDESDESDRSPPSEAPSVASVASVATRPEEDREGGRG